MIILETAADLEREAPATLDEADYLFLVEEIRRATGLLPRKPKPRPDHLKVVQASGLIHHRCDAEHRHETAALQALP